MSKLYEISITCSATVSMALNVSARDKEEAIELFKKKLKKSLDCHDFNVAVIEPPSFGHDWDDNSQFDVYDLEEES